MFFPSVSGMEAQSHAMTTVSTNIANVRTTGYKSSETMFYTLLGSTPVVKGNNSGISSSKADISGVGTYDRTNVTKQGIITPTGQNFDVAIKNTGNAFFLVKDSGGNSYYTRAGDFETRTLNGKTYLITPNGYMVQGYPANADGTFGTTPGDISFNPQEKIPSVPTSNMEIVANVSSDEDSNAYGLTVYGPNNDGKNMSMVFKKTEGKVNTWTVDFSIEDGGTVSGGPFEVQFDDQGKIVTPKSLNVSVQWDEDSGGGSNNISIDISKMTQYTGSNNITNIAQDGAPSGNYIRSYIDSDGVLKSEYSNKKTVNHAQLSLVGFEAPENLEPVSNTMFQANRNCGDAYFLDNNDALATESLESSTANVETEFSRMVVIQRAYSLNAQAFTKADEMLQVLVDLKS